MSMRSTMTMAPDYTDFTPGDVWEAIPMSSASYVEFIDRVRASVKSILLSPESRWELEEYSDGADLIEHLDNRHLHVVMFMYDSSIDRT